MSKRFNNKSSGLIVSMDLKDRSSRAFYWCSFAILMILCLVIIIPAIWIILSAFKDTKEFYMVPSTLLPKYFQLSKAYEVWKQYNFSRYYLNTIVLVIGTVASSLLFNGLGGYILSRIKPKGSALFGTLVFWSLLIPNNLSLVPLYMTFVNMPIFHINLSDTYFPMWMMAGAGAFNLLMFRNFFNSIPMGYLEAAKIDGCTTLNAFFRIILPLSKPIIIVVAITGVTGAWGSFLWPYMLLKSDSLMPIAVKLYNFKQSGIPIDIYMMAILFTIIPPSIIYAFFSKQIMGGLNMSGLKG